MTAPYDRPVAWTVELHDGRRKLALNVVAPTKFLAKLAAENQARQLTGQAFCAAYAEPAGSLH